MVLYYYQSREGDFEVIGEIWRYWRDSSDRRGREVRYWVLREDVDEAQEWVQEQRTSYREDKKERMEGTGS